MAKKAEGLVYRSHPLRRIGKTIYYGSMADSHIIQMHVKESKTGPWSSTSGPERTRRAGTGS